MMNVIIVIWSIKLWLISIILPDPKNLTLGVPATVRSFSNTQIYKMEQFKFEFNSIRVQRLSKLNFVFY